ncbi:extracellular solute-binding protein [Paenibacillus koleovorans]|uniref:extracellular solute-binding protein n=1 Tax=Paenibacillus koleovorans TaxID=121608 RepID=UPI000FDBA578|nr:extracellular solute-binding protein [Paenibacillus koleovorans]
MTDRPSRATFHDRLDEMVSVLRDEIMTGKRQAGEFLASERLLGKQFRISNKSVRDALATLQAEGLIEKIPKVGSRVASLPDEKAIRIRFAYHSTIVNEADLAHLISMFHLQYPQIRVQSLPLMSRQYDQISQILESDVIDVLTVNLDDFNKLVEEGIVDLFETLSPNQDIYPYLTRGFVHEDELKAQPFIFSPVMLCYNKAHFQQTRVPEPDSSWTWDDLLEHAKALAIPGERFGFYTHLQSRNRWPVFFLQSGMKFPKSGGQVDWVDSPWLEAARICRRLLTEQGLVPIFDREEDAEELFKQEKASVIMTTYFRLNDLKKVGFEYDVAPLPYSGNSKTMLLTIGLAQMSSSKYKEASRTFLKFLQSEAAQLTIRTRTLSIPALKPAAEWSGKETMYRPSRFQMHREIVPTFGKMRDLDIPNGQSLLLLQECKYYWSGLYSEEVLVRKLQQLVESYYGSRDNQTIEDAD